jgi:hypothetical protein
MRSSNISRSSTTDNAVTVPSRCAPRSSTRDSTPNRPPWHEVNQIDSTKAGEHQGLRQTGEAHGSSGPASRVGSRRVASSAKWAVTLPLDPEFALSWWLPFVTSQRGFWPWFRVMRSEQRVALIGALLVTHRSASWPDSGTTRSRGNPLSHRECVECLSSRVFVGQGSADLSGGMALKLELGALLPGCDRFYFKTSFL